MREAGDALFDMLQEERERIHLLLIDDASKGLADVAAGKVKDARSTLTAITRRRASKTSRRWTRCPPNIELPGLPGNARCRSASQRRGQGQLAIINGCKWV